MFLRRVSESFHRTSEALSARFVLFAAFLFTVFTALTDYYLYQSLLDSDKALIQEKLTAYHRAYVEGGSAQLLANIRSEGISPEDWLVELETQSQPPVTLFGQSGSGAVKLHDLTWPVIDIREKRWLIRALPLSDNTQLLVGLSSLPRQKQLVRYRLGLISVLTPLFLLSVWIFRRIYRATLLPIRDLLDTTDHILATGQLSHRVPVSDLKTELGKLSAQTNHFLDTIERMVEGMNKALDNVAHDLRTPLSRQRLGLEKLLTHYPSLDKDQQLDELGKLYEENELMSEMLRTLIDISEAEAGVMRLDRQKVDLQPLLAQVQEMYQFIAEDRGIVIELQCDKALQADIDPIRIQRAIGNLVDNAVKFSAENGLVSITAVQAEGGVKITVADQGQGIKDTDIPHLFDRLYRGDEARHTRGMGLGLSLVSAIVGAHQGTIAAANRTDLRGAVFTVVLPV